MSVAWKLATACAYEDRTVGANSDEPALGSLAQNREVARQRAPNEVFTYLRKYVNIRVVRGQRRGDPEGTEISARNDRIFSDGRAAEERNDHEGYTVAKDSKIRLKDREFCLKGIWICLSQNYPSHSSNER